MTAPRGKALKWGVERRYEFIEFRLYWHGRINRGDLMEAFGISMQQASGDLNAYLAAAEGNIVYDKSAKAYVRGPDFAPRHHRPDAADFLNRLRALESGLVPPEQSWIPARPDFGAAPTPFRAVAPEILREVYGAVCAERGLWITYQSLSRPEPTERVVEPHAFAFDGFRWHARAFCRVDGVFKDFLLSRVLATGDREPRVADPAEDLAWRETVEIEIAPHPDLSAAQKAVFEVDYGMTDGRARIPVRRAMLYYALKRLGLDTDPSSRSPADQQIVLLNRDELFAGR